MLKYNDNSAEICIKTLKFSYCLFNFFYKVINNDLNNLVTILKA